MRRCLWCRKGKDSDTLKACLHQASTSMLRDATDSVLIGNSGVACKWVATPFWSDSIIFNENGIVSIIAALTLMLGINGP